MGDSTDASNPLLTLLSTTPDPPSLSEHHSISPEDGPIRLQYRQPSFSSLTQSIGKDGEPVPRVSPAGAPLPIVEEPSPDTDFAARLSAANQSRWAEIGYEPPKLDFTIIPEETEPSPPPPPLPDLDLDPAPSPSPLPLRLPDLDPALTTAAAPALLGGDIRDLPSVRDGLRRLLDECAGRLWVEESVLVSEALARVNATERTARRLGFHRPEPARDHEQALREREALEAELQRALDAARARLAQRLAGLNAAYQRRAEDLDAKYQSPETLDRFAKPSRELRELRVITQRLLKQNRALEAEKYAARIAQLEQAEAARCNAELRRKYDIENRTLKEEFATKREVLCKKVAEEMEEEERKFGREIQRTEKIIVKLQRQVEEATAVEVKVERAESRASRRGAPSAGGEFAETGRLRVTPIRLLNRESDLAQIENMTIANLNHGSPRSARADAILRDAIVGGR